MVGNMTRIPRGSPPAILLREGYRQDGTVKTRTLANLSKLPELRLKGPPEAFDAIASLHHGHVEAVLLTMLVLPLLASGDPVRLALVAARI